MIPPRLLRSEATIIQRTQTGPDDDFGTPTWEETEIVMSPDNANGGVHVQPAVSDEVEDRPAGRFTHRAWWLREPATSLDRLILSTGQTWDIDGPPRVWVNPRNGRSYTEVDLVGYDDIITDEESESA